MLGTWLQPEYAVGLVRLTLTEHWIPAHNENATFITVSFHLIFSFLISQEDGWIDTSHSFIIRSNYFICKYCRTKLIGLVKCLLSNILNDSGYVNLKEHPLKKSLNENSGNLQKRFTVPKLKKHHCLNYLCNDSYPIISMNIAYKKTKNILNEIPKSKPSFLC